MNDYHISHLEEIERKKKNIRQVFGMFGIDIIRISVSSCPFFSTFELIPEKEVNLKKVSRCEDEILKSFPDSSGMRMLCPIPGRYAIGLEIPNEEREPIAIEETIASADFQKTEMTLPCVIGKTSSNKPFIFDLTKAPHVLVSGAKGQGKSQVLHSIILSLLSTSSPEQLKFVMIEPKPDGLSKYRDLITQSYIKSMNCPDNIHEAKDAAQVIRELRLLMEERYMILDKAKVHNISEYNQKVTNQSVEEVEPMPYVVVIIDEYADYLKKYKHDFGVPLSMIAQKSRAVGIHLVLATEQSTAKVITGNIKANIPLCIACRTNNIQESRIILNTDGAERLSGPGDLLVGDGCNSVRIQGFYSDGHVMHNICQRYMERCGTVREMILPDTNTQVLAEEDIPPFSEDPLIEKAALTIAITEIPSTSLLQRSLMIGYNRACSIMKTLETLGIISAPDQNMSREILIRDINIIQKMFQ